MAKLKCILAALFLLPALVWSGGSSEAAASAGGYGKYLAGGGTIIPPDRVVLDSYIAAIDYHYPRPEGDIGVSLYLGNRQVSARGQEEIIQIGIQAKAREFADLPPMNLAFVIDRSSSMADANKLDWVKSAFDIFIDKVRDKDFVSLVIFNSQGEVLFPSTQMNGRAKRERLKSIVRSITAVDGTNLVAGLELGYQQVLANFRSDYTNRVLFLTDGRGTSTGMLEMADSYRAAGISVSTIGVGKDFDLPLMSALAQRGGGSSRFIADRKSMEETFGTELDRMVVPAARDLTMKLELLVDAQILGTWGYDAKIDGSTIRYSLPTLHHRDYETILAQIAIKPTSRRGVSDIARFTLDYADLDGVKRSLGPYYLAADIVDADYPVYGFSDGMVLHSGTMLHFGRALQDIGNRYYSARQELQRSNQLRNARYTEARKSDPEASYDGITSPEIEAAESSVSTTLQAALDATRNARNELVNARLRLDDTGFDDEIAILDSYLKVLGSDLKQSAAESDRIVTDTEIAPPVVERSLPDQLSGLFREMSLALESRPGGTVAVSGFAATGGRRNTFTDVVDESAMLELSRAKGVTLLERSKLDALLKEQELGLSDLMDTTNAIKVGKFLAAQYILTGSVIEMPSSVVVFGRIINVETSEVESASQVIIPKSPEIRGMLSP